MPEYLSPGVYIEESEIGSKPIEGISTSTAGFLGISIRGPLEPQLVTGFEQFKRVFGSYLPRDESNLAYAVDGFFMNGGQRCFVARIVAQDAAVMTGAVDTVNIEAAGPGQWGNRIAVKIEAGGLQDDSLAEPRDRIKLTVMYWDVTPPADPPVDPNLPTNATDPNLRAPTTTEIYDNLSADPTSIDYFETRINRPSNLIRIAPLDPANPINPASQALAMVGTNGADGSNPILADYQGRKLNNSPDPAIDTGLLGFEGIDEISIVCAPDHHTVGGLHTQLITHCEQLKDRFVILHSQPSENLNTLWPLQPSSSYAAFYFPWIQLFDPRTNQKALFPPSGHVAGIYAKTDIERGVHKAPANVVVAGATGLSFKVTKSEQDVLNPRGVNCIRAFRGRGIRVWGARTSSNNSLWKYINVRRLFLFIEESIEEGTQWVVFEPNDHKLWVRVRQTITQFLTIVWRNGALMGTKAEEAFFVRCDHTTMTQDDIDNGRLICTIGIAPVKPAEFVIFRITQFTGGSEIEEL